MGNGATVIRYIDICLNLLFGFICFSELSQHDKIELPTTVELKASHPDAEIVVFVGVQSNGVYLLDGEKIRTLDMNVVEQFLVKRKNELAQGRYKMRVRVRANYDTPTRFVMHAVDICDKLDVARSVDVRLGKKSENVKEVDRLTGSSVGLLKTDQPANGSTGKQRHGQSRNDYSLYRYRLDDAVRFYCHQRY